MKGANLFVKTKSATVGLLFATTKDLQAAN